MTDCRPITSTAGLRELADAWGDVVADSNTNYPTCGPQWQLPWWEVFAHTQRRDLHTLTIYKGKQLVGVAPFTRRRLLYHRAMPVTRLELLGCGETESDAVCSCYSGIVARGGYEQYVAEQLASFLISADKWDELVLPELASEGKVGAFLEQQLRWRGLHTRISSPQSTYVVDLPNTWDGYIKTLSRKGRYFVRRSIRDYESWAGDDAAIHHATKPEQLEKAYAILRDLNRERWADCSIQKSDAFHAFHHRMLPRLAERGAAVISWTEAHGRPIAALYQILWNNRCFAYQAGRTMNVPDDVRPGIALHGYAIRNAIERGDTAYDLLCGSSRYKTQIGATPRPLLSLHAWKPSMRIHLCIAADETIAFLRGMRRRHRDRERCTAPK